MPDYIIIGNTSSCAGKQLAGWSECFGDALETSNTTNAWNELSWTVILKNFWILMKIMTHVLKSSKMGPHLGRILLKRPHFPHCKAFDLQVRKAIFRLWKHCTLLPVLLIDFEIAIFSSPGIEHGLSRCWTQGSLLIWKISFFIKRHIRDWVFL